MARCFNRVYDRVASPLARSRAYPRAESTFGLPGLRSRSRAYLSGVLRFLMILDHHHGNL